MAPSIAPATEQHYAGLHQALDIVARERHYLAFTEAPPLPQSIAFYRHLHAERLPHLVALDGDHVVGWADISRSVEHEGVRRRGSRVDDVYHDVLAMGLLKP